MSKKRIVNVRIVVHKDDNIEKALRKFKRATEKAGIKKQVKSRRYYEKPSEARRKEERKRIRNINRSDKKPNARQNNRANWLFVHPDFSEEK